MEALHLTGFRHEIEKDANFGKILSSGASFVKGPLLKRTSALVRRGMNTVKGFMPKVPVHPIPAPPTDTYGRRVADSLKGMGATLGIMGTIGVGGAIYGGMTQPSNVDSGSPVHGRYSL